ncbi:MAG: hypothetical protein DWH91_19145 [Planctomycetota bacterium]|nr:MAG: hypothetical protein DWH91_19145 [Planctomycetota bacterium]
MLPPIALIHWTAISTRLTLTDRINSAEWIDRPSVRLLFEMIPHNPSRVPCCPEPVIMDRDLWGSAIVLWEIQNRSTCRPDLRSCDDIHA